MERISDENYENLANAIIESACKDYKIGKMSEREFRNFCSSEWFMVLTKLNGDELFIAMQKERRIYNEKKEKRSRKKQKR